jgi:hypothetical protein
MRILFTALALLLASQIWAQAPQKFSYQAVVRNPANALVVSSPVGLNIKIRQGSATGTVVYEETHSLTSNNNGLVTAEIGAGNVVSGSMAGIDWSSGPYYIEAASDPQGGTNYSLASSTELLSVPYALYAAESANSGGGGTPITAGVGLSLNGSVMDAQTTSPLWNANALQSGPVAAAAPSLNDVLTWNGSSWIPAAPAGGGGGGTNINCSTSSNNNYTVRGTGNGGWECTNAIWVTSTDRVGIGTTSPSSSYDLNIGTGGFLVDGSSTTSNIQGRLRIGSTSSTSYELQVDGEGYFTSRLRIGTTSTPATGGIYANGAVETNNRFIQNSSTSGSGTPMIRTSSGELRPQSSTMHVKTNIQPLRFSKEQLFALRPVRYNLKPALGGEEEVGLIAEQVAETMPELVIYGPERTWKGDSGIPATDENGKELVNPDKMVPYSVHYDRLAVYLLDLVKEQDQYIQQMEQRLKSLEERLEKLEQ